MIRQFVFAIGIVALASIPAFGKAPKAPTAAGKQRVEFYLHSVKSIHETNRNTILGSDEIYLGGTAISPDKKTHKIKVFKVHGDMDKGQSKIYNPPLLLHTFKVKASDAAAPKPYYNVSLILIEKDHGTKVQEFVDKYDEKLKQKLQTAAVGTGDPITIALTALAGPVFDQIKKLLGDDPFRPMNTRVAIRKSGDKPLKKTMTFKGNGGGEFVLTYEWRLVD